MVKIGERINIKLYYYELTATWETPFGPIFLYTFNDYEMNTYVWKTSRFINSDISVVRGTIKEKVNYNGSDEFVLTYCRYW